MPWKWSFAASTICNYAKEQKLPISEMHPDRPTGALLAELVTSVYKADYAESRQMVLNIIKSPGYTHEDIINMAYNFEGVLLEFSDSERLITELWRHTTGSALETGVNPLSIADMFLDYKRFELVLGLFEQTIAGDMNALSLQRIIDSFLEIQTKDFVEGNRSELLALYYVRLSKLPESESLEANKGLLRIMMKDGLIEPFSFKLSEFVASRFPYAKLSQEEVSLLYDTYNYVTRTLQTSAPLKMVHLIIGDMFAKADNIRGLNVAIKNTERILTDNPFDLSRLDDSELNEYLEWVLEGIVMSSKTHTDLQDSFDIFGVRGNIKSEFIRKLSEMWRRVHKKNKWLDADLVLIAFVLSCGTAKDRESFGKSLSTKGKKELEALDDAFRSRHSADYRLLADWDRACEVGAKTNALAYGLGKLLKKK
jgi:hypothetical protein